MKNEEDRAENLGFVLILGMDTSSWVKICFLIYLSFFIITNKFILYR